MKYLIFAMLTAGYILWPGCHDPDKTPPEENTLTCEDTILIRHPGRMEHGFVKAVKTCRDWQASGTASLFPNSMSISGHTFTLLPLANGDTSFLLAESLSFSLPKKTGKFLLVTTSEILQDSASCSFSNIDIDVATANWVVDASEPDNYLEITELDLVNKRVKGNFSAHFKLDFSVPSALYFPAKLFFYEGEFDVEIVN